MMVLEDFFFLLLFILQEFAPDFTAIYLRDFNLDQSRGQMERLTNPTYLRK